MTDKDRCVLALSVLAGTVRRLDLPDITALGVNQPAESPCSLLYLGDGDFCWRGEVASGPLKGAPLKVNPQEVREGAVRVLVEALDRVGAFSRWIAKNPKVGVSPQQIKGSKR